MDQADGAASPKQPHSPAAGSPPANEAEDLYGEFNSTLISLGPD